MKKLLYIILFMISNCVAHRLEKVTTAIADNPEHQLQLATITLYFDAMPAVQKIVEKQTGGNGLLHDRYFFAKAMISDDARKWVQESSQHTSKHYYVTYDQVASPDGVILDVYYDPRYIMYHSNQTDGINLEHMWVLHFFNVVLLDMYRSEDKPLVQFAYCVNDKYKTSCFLV